MIPDGSATMPSCLDTEHLVAESLLRSALLSLDRGDHEAAERSLREGLARVPEHPACLATLALCLAEGQRRYVTAERLAARAIKVAPAQPAGYHALGRIYRLGGRKQQAFRFLVKARNLAPGDVRVADELSAMGRRRPPVIPALARGHPLNVSLGRVRTFLSDGRRATLVIALILVTLVSVVSAALSAPADPAAAGPRQLLGGLARVDSLLAANDPAAAAASARALRPLGADNPSLGWQIEERLGLALTRLDRSEEAVACFEAALRDAPGAASLHHNLASALMKLGRRGRAFAEFEAAVGLDPRAWRAHVDYGQALASYGQAAAARRELEAGMRLCGDCAEAARALAALHLAARDYAAALPLLEKAHAATPTHALRKALALARLRTGDAWGATRLLAPAWFDSLDLEERRLLLEADRAVADPARALSLVGGSRESDSAAGPGSGDAALWGQAAVILIEAARDAEALIAVDRALALDPRQPAYRNNRVLLLDRLGRRAEADAEWRRAVELDPSLADKRR